MSAPHFSVIVPTRDRNALLARCLEQLSPGVQTFGGAYEVIVTDDSPALSARTLAASGFSFARWTEGPRRGPAANRNVGASVAGGTYLVFVDDDCIPEPGLLAGYAEAIVEDVPVYEGRITCKGGIDSPRKTSPVNVDGGHLWSCNFAIRRDAFELLSGFDERFPIAHLEDADLRDRLLAAGMPIAFVPGASVDHPARMLAWGGELAQMHRVTILYMTLHPPTHGLLWFLQGQLRFRMSHIVHRPFSIDSLSAIGSVAMELLVTAWHWRSWSRWARNVAGSQG
ncbi:hypothetical protein BH09GEM1_BH09GEM1_18800 [soil metagenome]